MEARGLRAAGPGTGGRGGAAREILQERVVAGPHLTEEQRVHDARGVDEARERVAFVLGERGKIRADLGRRESRRHSLKLG